MPSHNAQHTNTACTSIQCFFPNWSTLQEPSAQSGAPVLVVSARYERDDDAYMHNKSSFAETT